MLQVSIGGLTRARRWRALAALAAIALTTGALAVPAAAASSAPAAPRLAGAPLATAAATSADRIAGADRYQTAVLVSSAAFAPGVERVFLASGIDYPDALSAAPIAAALGAPLLLTARDALPPVVVTELARLAPTAEVVIVGGTAVVSTAVESRLRQLGYTVSRVLGLDRYDTSRALITAHAAPSTTAVPRDGPQLPRCARRRGRRRVGRRTGAARRRLGGDPRRPHARPARRARRAVGAHRGRNGRRVERHRAELLGLEYAAQRLAGLDRFGTAVAINQHAFPSAQRAFVATGAGFADALAGAVYAAVESAPLYSSSPVCLPVGTRADMLERLQVERVTLLGGPGVLSARVQALDECSTIDDDRAASAAVLTAALQARISTLPGTYSVSVRELGGLQTAVSIRGGVAQEPVSVIKVFVAYAVLDRIDRGLVSFASPTRSGVSVGECLRVMIHVSDNYCHHDLVALVGVSNLTTQLRAEGYRGTSYTGASSGSVPYASKLTSTDDLALLLSRLERGELLSPAMTAHFMTLLETQLWRSKIPSGVAAGVPVANKTGSAWTSAGWYHSDAGIVSAPAGPYVVAVLGSGGASVTGVREISRIVYEHFNGTGSPAATFSDLNLVTAGPVTYYRYSNSSTPLGTIPAGVRLETTESARTWYLVTYNGSGVWVHSSGLRNAIDYPRSL